MPPSDPTEQTPYDFFLQNQPKQKRSFRSLIPSTSSGPIKFLIAAFGVIFLIVMIAVVASLLSKGSGTPSAITQIAQQQSEMIRVSNEALTGASQTITQNLAVNINLSLTTDQNQLLQYLSQHGNKMSSSTLGAGKNSLTDQQLTAATQAGTYDSAYVNIAKSELTSYLQLVKTTFNTTKTSAERQLLYNDYQAGQILLTQATNTAGNLASS
jgi:flagellar basal body-associated protein FliL